jgi:lipoxygenase
MKINTSLIDLYADPLSEERSSSVYVPRDESFSEVKQLTFSVNAVYSVLHAVVPSLETAIIDTDLGFPYFTEIDKLFNEGVNLPPLKNQNTFRNLLPRLLKAISDAQENVLKFETPETMDSEMTLPLNISSISLCLHPSSL